MNNVKAQFSAKPAHEITTMMEKEMFILLTSLFQNNKHNGTIG